jgi:hypothetical protein
MIFHDPIKRAVAKIVGTKKIKYCSKGSENLNFFCLFYVLGVEPKQVVEGIDASGPW